MKDAGKRISNFFHWFKPIKKDEGGKLKRGEEVNLPESLKNVSVPTTSSSSSAVKSIKERARAHTMDNQEQQIAKQPCEQVAKEEPAIKPQQVEVTSTKSVTQESALEPEMFTRNAVLKKLNDKKVDERLRDAFVRVIDKLLGTEELFKKLQLESGKANDGQGKDLKEVVWEKYDAEKSTLSQEVISTSKGEIKIAHPTMVKGVFDALWDMVTSRSGK